MNNEKYCLWGAGSYGARTIEFFKDDIKFEAVIDSNPEKQHSLIHGIMVISPEEALRNSPKIKIIISQNIPTSVRTILLNNGLMENQDFFTLHDFVPRFYWNKDRSLAIKSVDIAVTTMCNKRCDGCQTCIPFAKKQQHFSAETVISDLDVLFSYVSKIMNLNICCGESLLNPELPDICLEIYSKYVNRYQTMSLQTNATILPDAASMQKFSNANITLVTPNYPEQAKTTVKLLDLCKQYNIPWLINSAGNRGFWYDFGDPRMINETDRENLQARYKNCWKPGMGLNNGWLHICGTQLWSQLVAEVGTLESGDAFDLRQPVTDESREELRKILFREPPEQGYISHCARCLSVLNPLHHHERKQCGVQDKYE